MVLLQASLEHSSCPANSTCALHAEGEAARARRQALRRISAPETGCRACSSSPPQGTRAISDSRRVRVRLNSHLWDLVDVHLDVTSPILILTLSHFSLACCPWLICGLPFALAPSSLLLFFLALEAPLSGFRPERPSVCLRTAVVAPRSGLTATMEGAPAQAGGHPAAKLGERASPYSRPRHAPPLFFVRATRCRHLPHPTGSLAFPVPPSSALHSSWLPPLHPWCGAHRAMPPSLPAVLLMGLPQSYALLTLSP